MNLLPSFSTIVKKETGIAISDGEANCNIYSCQILLPVEHSDWEAFSDGTPAHNTAVCNFWNLEEVKY